MNKIPTRSPAQSAIASQASSGPLPQPNIAGYPRTVARRSSTSMSRSAVTERSTRPPRHSRVSSSTMDTPAIGRPSVVASNWKSTAQTLFGASAFGRPGAVLGAGAFASSPVRHAQPFFAPESLDVGLERVRRQWRLNPSIQSRAQRRLRAGPGPVGGTRRDAHRGARTGRSFVGRQPHGKRVGVGAAKGVRRRADDLDGGVSPTHRGRAGSARRSRASRTSWSRPAQAKRLR